MRIELRDLSPEPGRARCDFCSAPGIRWVYPCRSFEVDEQEIDGRTFIGRSVADWAACESCHGLIEAGDRDALARRTYAGSLPELRETWEQLKARLGEREMIAQIRVLHDQFFYHRRGRALPWPAAARLAILREAVRNRAPLLVDQPHGLLVIGSDTAAGMLAIHDQLDQEYRIRFLSLDWPAMLALTRRALSRLRRHARGPVERPGPPPE